jgi:hypothetical protein
MDIYCSECWVVLAEWYPLLECVQVGEAPPEALVEEGGTGDDAVEEAPPEALAEEAGTGEEMKTKRKVPLKKLLRMLWIKKKMFSKSKKLREAQSQLLSFGTSAIVKQNAWCGSTYRFAFICFAVCCRILRFASCRKIRGMSRCDRSSLMVIEA